MKYPNGETVSIGDMIWWNEGTCLGIVSMIVCGKADFQLTGQTESGILIRFNILESETEGGGLYIHESDFVDENICKCKMDLARRILVTRNKISKNYSLMQAVTDSFGVNRFFFPKDNIHLWIYIFYKSLHEVNSFIAIDEEFVRASVITENQYERLKQSETLIDANLELEAI